MSRRKGFRAPGQLQQQGVHKAAVREGGSRHVVRHMTSGRQCQLRRQRSQSGRCKASSCGQLCGRRGRRRQGAGRLVGVGLRRRWRKLKITGATAYAMEEAPECLSEQFAASYEADLSFGNLKLQLGGLSLHTKSAQPVLEVHSRVCTARAYRSFVFTGAELLSFVCCPCRVECPHCGRRFAELVAERHIPKCSDIIAKPTRLKAAGTCMHCNVLRCMPLSPARA